MPSPLEHMQVAPVHRHGVPPISTLGLIGVHVPAITGMQGCGVNTPNAAAVAAATIGLARELHIANDVILTIGITSRIVPAGFDVPSTVGAEVALNVPGALPNGQESCAPVTTNSPISVLLSDMFHNRYALLGFFKGFGFCRSISVKHSFPLTMYRISHCAASGVRGTLRQ